MAAVVSGNYSSLLFESCQFNGNLADAYGRANHDTALCCRWCHNVIVAMCVSAGGGAYCSVSGEGSTMSARKCMWASNSANSQYGMFAVVAHSPH